MKAWDYEEWVQIHGVGAAQWVSNEGNGRGKQPLGFAPPRPKVELPPLRRSRPARRKR